MHIMAVEVETSIVVNRPLEEVFAFISDFENENQWSSAVSSAKYLEGGPGKVGSTVRFVANFLSRDIESISKTRSHEPNHKIDFELIKGTVTGKGWRKVEAVGNATQVTQRFNFEFGGLFRAVKFILKPTLQKQLDGDFKKLKAVLES